MEGKVRYCTPPSPSYIVRGKRPPGRDARGLEVRVAASKRASVATFEGASAPLFSPPKVVVCALTFPWTRTQLCRRQCVWLTKAQVFTERIGIILRYSARLLNACASIDFECFTTARLGDHIWRHLHRRRASPMLLEDRNEWNKTVRLHSLARPCALDIWS